MRRALILVPMDPDTPKPGQMVSTQYFLNGNFFESTSNKTFNLNFQAVNQTKAKLPSK